MMAEKEKLLISACLLGIPCRYDGRSVRKIGQEDLVRLSRRYELIPVCPEVYGGLPTPRTPSERVGDRVLMRDGRDVTAAFAKGAAVALSLAELFGAHAALLKEKSPSCGTGAIYDGSFRGVLCARDGVTAELLRHRGIAVFGERELCVLLSEDPFPKRRRGAPRIRNKGRKR